jgi:prepilin-type N-terminal cleavage/methylation domain-containing protein
VVVQVPSSAHNSGFTFIELLVVIAVIAVLATLGTVATQRTLIAARNAKRASILHDAQAALELYNVRNEQYFNSPNNFCGLLTMLTTNNYLPLMPADPKTQSSVCAGAGDGNPTVGGAMYVYEATPAAGPATTYLLKLAKEGGGYLNIFSSQ